MKIIFLGTNGWYSSETGDTLCVAVETEKYNIILDAGNGIRKIENYLDLGKETFLFLSHFHLDHIFGLHVLDKFYFPRGLRIIGPPGMRNVFATIMCQPFTLPLARLQYNVELLEVDEIGRAVPFNVLALPLKHVSPCYGYRFEIDGRMVAFCTDTGACENVMALAQGVDFLILECSFKDDQPDSGWPHLGPVGAAEIALKARARKLFLTHFEARAYGTIEDRYMAGKRARDVFADTTITLDGSEFEVGSQ